MTNGRQNHQPVEDCIQNQITLKKLITSWSNVHEFHHSSSLCKSVLCLYALLTTSRHALDEMADGVLGDLLPDLDQGISELLNSLWCYLAALDALIHNLPQVLNWIQVWRTWGPVNGFNAFIVQKMPHETRYYHAPGGTHEHRTSIRCDNGSEDFILVPNSNKGTVGKH